MRFDSRRRRGSARDLPLRAGGAVSAGLLIAAVGIGACGSSTTVEGATTTGSTTSSASTTTTGSTTSTTTGAPVACGPTLTCKDGEACVADEKAPACGTAPEDGGTCPDGTALSECASGVGVFPCCCAPTPAPDHRCVPAPECGPEPSCQCADARCPGDMTCERRIGDPTTLHCVEPPMA